MAPTHTATVEAFLQRPTPDDGCFLLADSPDGGTTGVVLNSAAATASPLLRSLIDGGALADPTESVVVVPHTSLPALKVAAMYITVVSDPALAPEDYPKAEFLPRPLGAIKYISTAAMAPIERLVMQHCTAESIANRRCDELGAMLPAVNETLLAVLRAADFLRVTSLATFAGALLAAQALSTPRKHDLKIPPRENPSIPPALVEATELNAETLRRCPAVSSLSQLQRRRFVDPFVPGTPIHVTVNGVRDFQAYYRQVVNVATSSDEQPSYAFHTARVKEITEIVVPSRFIGGLDTLSLPDGITRFENIAELFNGKYPSAPSTLLRPSGNTPVATKKSILEDIQWQCQKSRYLPHHVRTIGRALSSATSQLLEFPFVSGTSVQDTTPTIAAADGAAMASLRQLRPLCSTAPFGRGSETVVDTSVRRTLEVAPPAISVQWAGLDSALQQIARIMCPWHIDPSTGKHSLEASLYKVLLYSPGDLFKAHYDTKRCPGHELTLVVDLGLREDGDCVGGDVVFSSCYKHVEGRRWHSENRGDWCAWWATERHAVSEVVAGNRVVATYNVTVPSRSEVIDVDDDAGLSQDLDMAKHILPYPSPCNVYHEDPNDAAVAHQGAAVRAASRPPLTLATFDAATASLEAAVAAHFDDLVNEARRIGAPFLGVVCRSMYCLDGNSTAPLSVLRGVDRAVAIVMARRGVKAACLTKVRRLNEVSDEHDDDADEFLPKPGPGVAERAVEVGLSRDDVTNDLVQRYEPRGAHVVLSTNGPEISFNTVFELDEGFPHTPAFGTLWLDALPQVYIPEGYCVGSELWGNAGTFSVYSYDRVALVFDIAPDTEPTTLATTAEASNW